MSSVTPVNNNKYVIRLSINGKQVRFKGFSNKREAQRVGNCLDELEVARKRGAEPPTYVKEWLDKVSNLPIYERLVNLGLAEPKKQVRTLEDLIEEYHKSLVHTEEATWKNYTSMIHNLLAFFPKTTHLDEITREDAANFGLWLRTTPLNTRTKEPTPLSEATANRRIGGVKQIFNFGVRIGWLNTNPFSEVKGGDSVNPENLAYIPADETLKAIEGIPIKWQLILGLGRFCGLRGPSEMHNMTWDDVHYRTEKEPGWLYIPAVKNKRHGRVGRRIPLPPVVEVLFREYKAQMPENHKVFPEMSQYSNFSVMTARFFDEARLPGRPNPWYNLRKSYCSDLLEQVKDIPVYEQIADHNYKVAAKHYQILHKGRMLKSLERISCFSGLERGLKKVLPDARKGSYLGSSLRTARSSRSSLDIVKHETKCEKAQDDEKCCKWEDWARQDSNLGPPPYQGRSVTSESVCLLSLAHFCLSPLFARFNRSALRFWYVFLVCMQKWEKLGKSLRNYAKTRYELAFFRALANDRFRVGGSWPFVMKYNEKPPFSRGLDHLLLRPAASASRIASWTAARITSCSASANREVAVAERLSSFGMAWSRNLLSGSPIWGRRAWTSGLRVLVTWMRGLRFFIVFSPWV